MRIDTRRTRSVAIALAIAVSIVLGSASGAFAAVGTNFLSSNTVPNSAVATGTISGFTDTGFTVQTATTNTRVTVGPATLFVAPDGSITTLSQIAIGDITTVVGTRTSSGSALVGTIVLVILVPDASTPTVANVPSGLPIAVVGVVTGLRPGVLVVKTTSGARVGVFVSADTVYESGPTITTLANIGLSTPVTVVGTTRAANGSTVNASLVMVIAG